MFPADRLSIQSKLVLMLLGVSIGSILVISYLGYANAEEAITGAVRNQLDGVRASKANLVQSQLESLRYQVLTLAESETAANAVRAFRKGFREIQGKKVTPEQDDALVKFYREQFLPRLDGNVDGTPVLETYLPRDVAGRYLQAEYIAKNKNPYEKMEDLAFAPDGSDYSAAHKAFHPRLSQGVEFFHFEDIMLVDAETLDVIYTYQKTVEFATNLGTGPFADTNLGRAVGEVRRSMDRGNYIFTDFEHYRPNLARASSFIATPVFEATRMIGILVVQFPSEAINRAMTGNFRWKDEGLGQTGEVYLVGSDMRMRSRSRFFIENRKAFLATLRRRGVPSKVVDRIDRQGMTILNLEVSTPAVRRALAGESGVMIQDDFRGMRVLCSYAPIEVEGLRWAILAEIETAEAFAPVSKFGRLVLAYSAGIIVAVTLLASVLAYIFLKPIRELCEGAARVGAGEDDVVVQVSSRDEFRDLADAFNGMARGLKARSDTIAEKARENDELLLNILPGPIVARMRAGDGDGLTDRFADVTVLFADLVGFTALSETFPAEKAIALLNDVVVAVDEAAERNGVEKVRTAGSSYLAVCGMMVPRIDHTNRVVEFARDLLKIVARSDGERGTALHVRVGIHCGPVIGGVVGRSKSVYDLWGDTVDVARGLCGDGPADAIRVTDAVRDRLRDLHEFDDLGGVGEGPLHAWAVRA